MASCKVEMETPAKSIVVNSKCTREARSVCRAEEQEGQTLEQNGSTDGADERRPGMGAAQRSEGQAFQQHPHQGRYCHTENKGQEEIDFKGMHRGGTAAKAPAI